MAKLCPRGKAAAKRKFKVYPSAYANMYASAVCSGKVTPGGKKNRKKAMSNTELKDQADYLNKTGKYKVKKQKTKTKHFYTPENFNKGGRVGLRFGSKKSNVQKIKETFNPKKSAAKKKKFPDLTGNGKVTFADILKGRGVKRG